jgi:hypothetical protein
MTQAGICFSLSFLALPGGPLSQVALPSSRGLPCDEGGEEAKHRQQDLVANAGQNVHEGRVREVYDDFLRQCHRCQQPGLLAAVQSAGV